MGKKIALIALAVLALLSCENPIQAGLGGKVDITVPVIHMVNPRNVGDHVKGVLDLGINASDDIGVVKVQVAITEDAEGNALPEASWIWGDAVFDQAGGLWTCPVDTTVYPDGDLPLMIRAEDATGKSVRFEGVYSSKNHPPEIELLIPALPEDPGARMELVTGGIMIGAAKDLWGVAPGYPLIQFWHKDGREKNPQDPADWQYLDSYAARSGEDWAASVNGRSALEFQFHAVDRSDPALPLEEMPGLRPGIYRFRFQVKDVDHDSVAVLYPAEGYYELEVVTARELPVVAVSARDGNDAPLTGQYHRDPFYIAADVSHTTGIYGALIEVEKEGEEGSVVLARRVYSDNARTGSGTGATLTRHLESFLIEPGRRYIHTDVDPAGNIADNDYLFADGTYTFTVQATSVQTSFARQTLTVYIDTTPPEVAITRVQPAVKTVNSGAKGPDEFTVNGFIAADMSSYDANNIGVFTPDPMDPSLGYREIKYLIKDAYDSAAGAKALYEDPGARYFDNPAAPVYKRPGSTASVIINTAALVPGQGYYTAKNQYLYFIARDKAGNYSFTTALLRVDQNTDKPEISIAGFDFSQRSPELLGAAANPNRLLDAERILSGTFTDDDGLFTGDAPEDNIGFRIYQDGDPNPKADLRVTADKLSILNGGKTVNFSVSLPPAPEPGNPSDDSHLADGTYSVEIEVRDSVALKNALKPPATPPLADLGGEAANTTAADTNAPKRRIYFVLDTQPPVLTETSIGNTDDAPYLTKGLFNLGGAVSDINGLRSLKVVQIEAGVAGSKTILSVDYNAAKTAPWSVPSLSLPQAMDSPNPHLRIGTFHYEITAMDVAQRTTNLTRQVVVDTEAPSLIIAQPVQGVWADGSVAVVKGTETDNHRTGPVFYAITGAPSMGAPPNIFKDSPAAYRSDGAWKELAVLGTDWSDSVALQSAEGGIGEGIFYLHAAAFDAAGNQTNNADALRSFGVDYHLPYMNAWTTAGIREINGSYYARGPYTLSFDAEDSNRLKGVEIRRNAALLNEPGGTGYTLTVDRSTDPGNRKWPVAFAHNDGVNGVNYSYTIELTDVGNKVNNLENSSGEPLTDYSASAFKQITVRVDTQGPELSVSVPAAGAPSLLNSAQLPVQGIAPDSGIPAGVRVYYAVDTSAAKTETLQPEDPGFASRGWTQLDLTDFSDGTTVTLAGAMANEGERHVHFIAYDRLGNRSAVVDRKFYVDSHAPQINSWGSALITQKAPSVNLLKSNSYSFGFTAYDTDALSRVAVTRNGTALSGSELTLNPPMPFPANTKTVLVTVNISGQAEGEYAYGIEIEDIAGRINPVNNDTGTEGGTAANAFKTFNVTVDTEAPALTVTSPRGSPAQSAFISSSKLFLTGDAADAHPGPVYFWDGPDTGVPGSTPSTISEAETAIGIPASGWNKASGTSSWTIDHTLSGTVQEGPRRVMIIAFDTAGNRSDHLAYMDDNGNSYAPVVYFPYAVDSAAPQLSELTGNDLDRKAMPASFHLNGMVGDSNGVRTITITQSLVGDNDPQYNFTYELFTIWDESVNPPALKPGGVYLKGPANGLNKPWDTGRYFNLAADPVAQPAYFSLPLKRTGAASYAHADGKSGDFDYILSATDKYGRTTALIRRVQVDLEPPELSFAGTNRPEDSWFDATAFVRGSGFDAHSGISVVYYWLGMGSMAGSVYTPPPPPGYSGLADLGANGWMEASGYTSWSVPLPISEAMFAEGCYTLYVIAVDAAGNISNPSFTTVISARDIVAGRIYTIESPGDTDWTNFGVTGAAAGTRFVAASDGMSGSGSGTVRPYYQALSYNFRVDKENPAVTETRVDPSVDVVYDPSPFPEGNKSPLRKGSFDLNAMLEDSHGVSRLEVKQTRRPGSGAPGTTLVILDKTYPAGPVLVNEPLGALPWDGSGSPVAAADGIYEYEFTVYDLTISDSDAANHKTAVATRRIMVDSARPVAAHISEPGELYQTMNADMIIRGIAADGAPGTIRKVLYWTGVATDTSATGDGSYTVPPEVPAYDPADPVYHPGNPGYATRPWKEVDYNSSGWSKEISLAGAGEGQQLVAVLAEDMHGNVSELKLYQPGPTPPPNTDNVSVRFFYKDYAPPVFLETRIAAETRVSQPPQFSLGGYVQDSNSVDRIVLTQHKMNGPVIAETQTFTLKLNKTSGDKASVQYWQFDGLPYLDYLGNSQSSYTAAGDGIFEASPISFTGTPFAGSGEFKYVITAYDVSARTTTQNRSVTIDTEPPTLTLGAPPVNPAPGSWLASTAIIKGNAYDAGGSNSGVDLVYFWYGDPASPPAPSSYASKGAIQDALSPWIPVSAGGAFEITLPVSDPAFAEGRYQLLVLALDLAGNIGGTTNIPATTGPVSYLFGADKAAPDADELSDPSPAADLHKTALFALGGTLYDSLGIALYENVRITQAVNDGVPVAIKVYGTGSAGSVAGYSEAASPVPAGRPAGTRRWDLTNLPRDPLSVDNPMGALADGKYAYRIAVKDDAGKESVITRVVYVDRSDPVAAITGPTELVNEKWYDGASISVTGTALDPAPSSGIDAVYIWHGLGSAAAPPALNLEPDGSVDSAGAAAGWAKAGLVAAPGNPGSAVWNSASYSLGGEGPRTIAVIVRDRAGHRSAPASKTFWVDNTPPTLLNIAPVASPRNGNFALSGQGWDSNGLKSLTVTQKKLGVGGADAEVKIFDSSAFGIGSGTGSGLDASNTASWSMAAGSLPRQQTPAFPYALEDGEYAYVITLTDHSGRTATETRTVLVDTTAPLAAGDSDLAVSYPLVTSWVSGTSLTIRGSAKDHNRIDDPDPPAGTLNPSGINRVWYYAAPGSAAEPGAPASPDSPGVWETANYDSATLQWNATFDLAYFGLTAGTQKLWVRACDHAGNLSAAYTRLFGVDQDDPAVTETTVYDLGLSGPIQSPPSFAYARDSNFTLHGAVTEANIDRIVITQHVRNIDLSYMNAAPVTIATLSTAAGGGIAGSGVVKDWTLPANNLPRRFAADGIAVDTTQPLMPAELEGIDKTFIYTITAYDLAGKVSNLVTRTVSIDKTGPELLIAKPVPMASFQNSVIEISGLATDGTEVKGVYYRITETPADSAAAAALLNLIAPVDGGGKRSYAVSDTITASTLWSKADGTDAWSRYVDFSTYFGGSIAEGALSLWVIAADTGNNYGADALSPGDPVRVDFTLDQNPPGIGAFNYNSEAAYQNISRLNKNIYAKGDFSFSFDVWDTNALGAPDPVAVRRNGTVLPVSATDGVSVTTQAPNPPQPGVTAAKNRRVVVRQKAGGAGLADGSYTYTVAVTDLANKTTEKTITVVVDTAGPDLTIGGIVPLVTETSGAVEISNVNGLFWFTVNATDGDSNLYPYQASPTMPDPDNGTNGSVFGGVKYYFAPAPGTPHPLADPFTDPGGVVLTQSAYRGAVNTETLVDGADYVLYVYARDGAGNVSGARYVNNLRIKQSTDLPVVNIPAMAAPSAADAGDGIAGAINLDPRNGGFPITGFVSDDDNVDALADNTKLLFSISQINPANVASAVWTPIPYGASAGQGLVKKEQSAVNSDRQWTFTYTVPATYGDGNYLFKLAVQDKDKAFPYAENQYPPANLTAPAVAAVERVYRLSVDKEAPSITVASIENTYKAAQTISGTLKEANLRSFKVSLDGGTVYDAFDSAGNPKTVGELLLNGTGETRNWTLNIPAAGFNALSDGPHSLLWSAEDAVGNPGSLGKTFYKDSSGPDINFTNINEDQMFIIKGQDSIMAPVWYNPKVGRGDETAQEALLKAVAEVITDGNPKLTGAFSDEFSTVFAGAGAAYVKFWYRFDYNAASTVDAAWTEATGAGYLPNYAELLIAPAKTVRWQIPLSGLGQGYHTVDIKVLDRWGSENGLYVRAGVNDPPAGKYYPYERVAFRLDSDPPVITVPAVAGADKALVDGATFGTHSPGQLMFTLKAQVRDVTLGEVGAKIYVGNSTIPRHVFALNPIVDGAERTLVINSPFTETDMTALLAAAAGAGETSNIFRLEILAVDGAPRQTVETLQFKMDGAPPVITAGNLVTNTVSPSYPTVIIEALPTIQGNISDDSGIGEAKYTIEQWSYALSAWQTLGSAENLSPTNFAANFVTMEAFTINLGSAPLNLTDGKYRISFDLKDKASPLPNQASKINGTTDSINNIEFFIDRASPALDIVQFKSPPFYSGAEVNEAAVDYMAVYLNVSDLNTITGIRGGLETDAVGTYPLTAGAGSYVPLSNYRLLIPKDAYPEGLHTLTLEARDGAGRTATVTRDFTLDKTLPMLQIIEPAPVAPEPLAEITSEAIIRGITVDNTSVSKLYYLFGSAEVANGTVALASFPANTTAVIGGKIWREFSAGIDKNGATIAAPSYTAPTATGNLDKAQGGGSLYNWTIRLPNSGDLAAGVNPGNPNGTYVSLHGGSAYLCELPIRFMMLDSAGNAATYDYKVIVNPKGDEPTVTIASPSPANTAAQNEVGGVITVVGAARDNDWIHRVAFRVIDGNEPDTGSPKTLPVYNALAGDGYAADPVTNNNYALPPYSDSRGGWHQAPIVGTPGSNVQWSVNLNNNGLLNAPAAGTRVVTVQVLAYDTPAANHTVAQTMGEITTVKVTFVDGLPFVVDNSVLITPEAKNGVPFNYDDPVANKRVGGTVTIKARIRDDNGLKELSWHGEDTTQYGANILSMDPGAVDQYARPLNAVQAGSLNAAVYYMWLAGGTRISVPFRGNNPPAGLTWAAPALTHGGAAYNDGSLASKAYLDYELSLTLDTRTLANKAGPLLNKAGTWILSVLATDHTDFKMPANWTLQIDNYYPLGTYTGNGVAAGTNYQLQGLAWDTGAGVTVQGIRKVVVWFSRGPVFIPLNERDSGAAFKAAAGAITVAHGRLDANKDNPPSPGMGNWDAGVINDGASPVKFPDLSYTRKYLEDGTTANPDYYGTNSANTKFISGIEIDRNEPTADNDGDGFLEGMADAGNNFQWYARIDTTKFLDGLLTAHYLVYDHAGNASYYSNNIFISNNPPKVTSVDIGTDILGVNSAEDPRGIRTVSANYGTTNIAARNKRLSFRFSIQGDLGAKPFHYRFGYVSSRSSTNATALVVGQIYAITAVGTVNWEAVGAPSGYGVGTTFMATDTTSFGTGTADLLTISNIHAANINSATISDHVFSHTYTAGDFGSGSNQIPDATGNNAWFVLRVYNSLKIPMKPDDGSSANGGMSQTGAGGVDVYSYTGQFEVWNQPFDVVRIGINVANDDTVKPEVKLWDLNPQGETAGVNGLNGLAPNGNGTAAQPPASIDLTPNAAKSPNLLKGGLYNPRNNNRNIERSGHIEPRYAPTPGTGSFFIDGNHGSATFSKDTLSGELILRGFAYDEQRLGAVYLRIDSPSAPGTEFKILQSDDSSAYNPANPGSRGLLVPVSGQPAFAYNEIGLEGHLAEWAYVWNTVNLPAGFVAGDNVRVQARVEDKRSAPNSSVTRLHPNTGESANGTTILNGSNDGRYPLVLRNADGWRLDQAADRGYNRIAVTLAPYLNSFQRDASRGYNSLRSRQGWYAFSRGETVTAQGWNLKYPSGDTTVTFDTAAATVNAAVSAQTPTGITFTAPAAAVSGNVILAANGVSTVNDRNDNRNPWNRDDYNLSVSGNELWIDDRAAHIWASDAGAAGTAVVEGNDRMQINASETPTDPALTMAPKTGILWASWSNTANAAVYMNTNQGAAGRIEIIRNSGGGGQLTTTDLYYAEPQRSYAYETTYPTVFYHSNRIYGNTYGVTQSGGLKGYDPYGGGRFDTASAGENHQYNVELTYHDSLNTQFEGYHRVVYRGDNIHVSYYDSKDKSLKYWFVKSGWAIGSGNYSANAEITSNGYFAASRHWMNLDGGSDALDRETTANTWQRVRPGGGTEGSWNFTRAGAAGPWSAIDLRDNGAPVIAYFDAEHSTLRLASATHAYDPNATGNKEGALAGAWKAQYAMESGDPNYNFAGEYVSIQIDQTNNDAHLAFFRSNSTQLIYLKLHWNSGTSTYDHSYGPSVILDESGANGKWADLVLDKQNRPWISYQDISRAGNFDGVKMAYYDPATYESSGAPSYDSNGVVKTGWETMNVPAIYKASDNRTGIEVWPHRDTPSSVTLTKTWAAAVGYTNPDYYRIAYYLKPRN